MKNQISSPYPEHDHWSILWLVLGCGMMIFLAGNWPLSLAGWLAPLFLIRFIRTQRKLWAYLLMATGLTVACTIAYLGGAGPGGIPPLVFGAILGLSYPLLYLVDRVIVGRLPQEGLAGFSASLVFPLLMTGYEFLLFNKLPFGSSGSAAYSQSGNLLLMQMISITGLWGLTFITTWFASTFNWAWERKYRWPEIRAGVLIYSSFLVVILVFGTIRMHFFTPQAGTVRIHAVSAGAQPAETALVTLPELYQTDLTKFRATTTDSYLPNLVAIDSEAQAGAQIVLLPETAFMGIKEDLDPIIAQVKELAKTEELYIAFGKILMDTAQAGIYMTIVDPSGEIVLDHFKYAYNLGLDYSQVELQTVDTPYGRLSGVLCGDVDNPGIIEQAGQKGVDIMLVPAADGRENTFWHYRLAAFRAVENGFSLVRSAMEGVSLSTDPYGRTLAAVDYYTTSDHVMVAQVPIHRVQTLFGMVGDWFGWLMVIGFIGFAGWAIFRSINIREPKAKK